MNKRFLIALMMLLALVGAACGSDDDGGGDDATTTTEGVIDDEVSFTEEEQAVVDAFEESFTAEGEAAAATYAPDGALEAVLVAAAEAAAAQGGLETSAQVTAVTINGDVAEVTYDLLLAGTPVLPGMTGHTVMVDGEWKTHISSICTLLTAASGGTPPDACAGVEAPTA
ncbi:MAG TPA: hypothetical protein VGA13_07535 [Acidimicrobiales bacterium]|jgi:hypothetical protein